MISKEGLPSNSSRSRNNNSIEGVRFNNQYGMLEFESQNMLEKVVRELSDRNSKNEYDSGNTQELIVLLNSNAAHGEIQNALIESSPLSDKVLLELLQQELPVGTIETVLMANTPFSEEVEMQITKSSLPGPIKDKIIKAAIEDIIIENPILDDFEAQFGFHSLRKEIEKAEESYLKGGGDPEMPANPGNHFIKDRYLASILNPKLEVKVGDDILKYLNLKTHVRISNGDLALLNQIRRTGQIPFYMPPASEPVNGINEHQAPPIVPRNLKVVPYSDRTEMPNADFRYTKENNTFHFIGAENKPGVKYRWEFGDGYVSYKPQVRHSYTGREEATVTLTVTDSKGVTETYSMKILIGNTPGTTGCSVS